MTQQNSVFSLAATLRTSFVVAVFCISLVGCGEATNDVASGVSSDEPTTKSSDEESELVSDQSTTSSSGYEDSSYQGPRVRLDISHGPETLTSKSDSTILLKFVGSGDRCALVLVSVDGEPNKQQKVCADSELAAGDWKLGLVKVSSTAAHLSVTAPDGEQFEA